MSTDLAVPASREQAGTLVRQHAADFASILPRSIRPEAWVRITMGVLARSDELATAAVAAPDTVMVALLNAARLGLEPGTEQFYLVPFKNRRMRDQRTGDPRPEVQGITGYQGHIQLMYRGGLVGAVHSDVVYEHDVFEFTRGQMDVPVHTRDWFASAADRGAFRGAYAWAEMKDLGTGQRIVSDVIIVAEDDIMRRARVNAFNFERDGSLNPRSIYAKWPEAMRKKAPCRILQKFVPTSAEHSDLLRESLVRAQQVAEDAAIDPARLGDPENPDRVPGDGDSGGVEAEFADEPAPVRESAQVHRPPSAGPERPAASGEAAWREAMGEVVAVARKRWPADPKAEADQAFQAWDGSAGCSLEDAGPMVLRAFVAHLESEQ